MWPAPVTAADVAGALAAAGVHREAGWLGENFAAHERRARGEARRVLALGDCLPHRLPVASIPAFDTDVHDLTALARMAAALAG